MFLLLFLLRMPAVRFFMTITYEKAGMADGEGFEPPVPQIAVDLTIYLAKRMSKTSLNITGCYAV